MKDQNFSNEKPILWAGVLIISDKKILVVKEVDKPFYIMPGGKVENNESDIAAAKREVLEELGAEVEIGDFFDVIVESSKNTGKLIRFKIFNATLKSNITKSNLPNRTEDFKYINSQYNSQGLDVGNLLNQLIPRLVKQGLID